MVFSVAYQPVGHRVMVRDGIGSDFPTFSFGVYPFVKVFIDRPVSAHP